MDAELPEPDNSQSLSLDMAFNSKELNEATAVLEERNLWVLRWGKARKLSWDHGGMSKGGSRS